MFTLIFLPIIFISIAISVIVRLVLRVFNPYGLRRPYFGPYGYNGYGHCYRRHRFLGSGLITILALVSLERLFGRRW